MVDSAVASDRATVSVTRRTTTIDELVSKFNLTPNVIKIDVEGFEELVLAGAAKTLNLNPSTLRSRMKNLGIKRPD